MDVTVDLVDQCGCDLVTNVGVTVDLVTNVDVTVDLVDQCGCDC